MEDTRINDEIDVNLEETDFNLATSTPGNSRAVTPSGAAVKFTVLNGTPIATLTIDNSDMLCLAQISATILSKFTYNEIHNRRVALSISTKPCNASQMEMLRCAGAVPPSSRRCGLITRHEAERLVRSFTEGTRPPNLPSGFAFHVGHQCGWGCNGQFYVEKYTSSRAKCIECDTCREYLAPNKFIFHSHRPNDVSKARDATFRPADAANFNSWRRHIFLIDADNDQSGTISESWEDVKALFNGGNRQNVNVLTMTTLVSTSAANEAEIVRPSKRQREESLPPLPLSAKKAKARTASHPSETEIEERSSGIRVTSTSPLVMAPLEPPTTVPSAANLMLIEAFLKTILLNQQQHQNNQQFPNECLNQMPIIASDHIGALNLAQPRWPNQQRPESSPSTDFNQFFIRNLIGQGEEEKD